MNGRVDYFQESSPVVSCLQVPGSPKQRVSSEGGRVDRPLPRQVELFLRARGAGQGLGNMRFLHS